MGVRSQLLGWVVARGWQRRPAEQRQNNEGESLPSLPPSRRRKRRAKKRRSEKITHQEWMARRRG